MFRRPFIGTLAPLALVLAPGCSIETIEIVIPSAFISDTGAILVALESRDEILQIGVADAGGPGVPRTLPVLPEYEGQWLRLSIVSTPLPLRDLLLEEGPVAAGHPERGSTRPLLSLFRAPPGTGALELKATEVEGETKTDWAATEPSELLRGFQISRRSLCEPPNTRVFNVRARLETDVRSTVFLDDGGAMAGGTHFTRTTTIWVPEYAHTSRIEIGESGKLEIAGERPIPGSRGLYSLSGSKEPWIGFDHGGDFVFLRADGSVRRRVQAPRGAARDEPKGARYDVAIGGDGSVFVFAPRSGLTYELTESSTFAVPRPDFPPNIRALSVLRRDLMIAFTGTLLPPFDYVDAALMVLEDGAWISQEVSLEEQVRDPIVLAHEDGFAALINADVLIRPGPEGAWRRFTGLEMGTQTTAKQGIAALGKEKYLVVGAVGFASIYDPKDGWCDIQVGTHRGLNRLAFTTKPMPRAMASEGSISRTVGLDTVEISDPAAVSWFDEWAWEVSANTLLDHPTRGPLAWTDTRSLEKMSPCGLAWQLRFARCRPPVPAPSPPPSSTRGMTSMSSSSR